MAEQGCAHKVRSLQEVATFAIAVVVTAIATVTVVIPVVALAGGSGGDAIPSKCPSSFWNTI